MSYRLILPDMEIEVSPLPSPAQMEAIVERKRKDNKTDRKMAENTNDEKKRKCDTPPVEEEGVSHQEERLLKLKVTVYFYNIDLVLYAILIYFL